MKRISIILCCLLLEASTAFAQGIVFEQDFLWKQLKQKAKTENKIIFIDCYATWCGPCKKMDIDIYPQPQVGTYFNEHFISVKMQTDKTTKDLPEIKKRYDQSDELTGFFEATALPSLIFYDPDQDLYIKEEGERNVADFITQAKNATKILADYKSVKELYQKDPADTAVSKRLLMLSICLHDAPTRRKVMNESFKRWLPEERLSKENLNLIIRYCSDLNDPWFNFFRLNLQKIDKALENDRIAENKVEFAIFDKEIRPDVPTPEAKADWSKIKIRVKKYGALGEEMFLRAKTIHFYGQKKWPEFATTAKDWFDKYSAFISERDLNDYAWYVFLNISDQALLNAAVEWSKRSIELKKKAQPSYLAGTKQELNGIENNYDTYANLLYKLGKKQEAIEWEEKIVKAQPDNKDFSTALAKMKAGQKTW